MKRLLLSFLLAVSAAAVLAQTPPLVNYQGRLSGSGTNFNGTGWFKFALVQPGLNQARTATATATVTGGGVTAITVTDGGLGYTTPPNVMITSFPGPQWGGATAVASVASGAVTAITVLTPGTNYNLGAFVTVAPPPPDYTVTTYWNNNGSIFDTEPTLPVPVAVADGLFNVNLGESPTVYLDPLIFTNSDLHLRLWFSADGTNCQRLTPDQRLTATPYALLAANAVNVVGILPASALAGTYGGAVTLSNAANSLAGSGSGLTALDAAHLESGTVADTRLSSNVALLNGNQTFSGTNNFANGAGPAGGAGSLHVGGYTANGDPKLIHFGDLQGNGLGYVYLGENGQDDRLELRAGSIYFNTSFVGVGLTNPAFALDVAGTVRADSFLGNASGLTGLSAASLTSGTVAATLTFSPPSGPPFAVGNSNQVANLNASLLGGIRAGDLWQLGGNNVLAGQFLGSTNNQPVEIWANGIRALRLEPNANGLANVLGGSPANTIAAGVSGAVIAGGDQNTILSAATGSAIGGGSANGIATNSVFTTIGGGFDNRILNSAANAVIAGGAFNLIRDSNYDATIGGGNGNTILAGAAHSTIAGGYHNNIQSNAPYAAIGGGGLNVIQANAADSYIGGGYGNLIQQSSGNSSIGGGNNNAVGGNAGTSTISGGGNNEVQADAGAATIGGGGGNTVQANAGSATIGGGSGNTVQTNASFSTIGGGSGNTVLANASFSTIGGGAGNSVSGPSGTVPGGDQNVATTNSFAAGHRAKAIHPGSFVWADWEDFDFATTGSQQFLIRAVGGVGINTDTPSHDLEVYGTAGISGPLSAGAITTGQINNSQLVCSGEVKGSYFLTADVSHTLYTQIVRNGITLSGGARCDGVTWIDASDKNLKEGFESLDKTEVLAKIIALPVTQWNYKTDGSSVQHIGPTAQDFRAAFGLGHDDISIATVDEGGVALAAIQGLNQKLEAQKAENAELKAQNDTLAQRLNELEAVVKAILQK